MNKGFLYERDSKHLNKRYSRPDIERAVRRGERGRSIVYREDYTTRSRRVLELSNMLLTLNNQLSLIIRVKIQTLRRYDHDGTIQDGRVRFPLNSLAIFLQTTRSHYPTVEQIDQPLTPVTDLRPWESAGTPPLRDKSLAGKRATGGI